MQYGLKDADNVNQMDIEFPSRFRLKDCENIYIPTLY